jgi:hypothetical protein
MWQSKREVCKCQLTSRRILGTGLKIHQFGIRATNAAGQTATVVLQLPLLPLFLLLSLANTPTDVLNGAAHGLQLVVHPVQELGTGLDRRQLEKGVRGELLCNAKIRT